MRKANCGRRGVHHSALIILLPVIPMVFRSVSRVKERRQPPNLDNSERMGNCRPLFCLASSVTCPSCDQTRTSLTAMSMAEEAYFSVAHRQAVLTIPSLQCSKTG